MPIGSTRWRLHGMEEVVGSNPIVSTHIEHTFAFETQWLFRFSHVQGDRIRTAGARILTRIRVTATMKGEPNALLNARAARLTAMYATQLETHFVDQSR